MKTHKNEEIYRYIASQYQQEMGKQLQAEKSMLQQQSPQADTRRLDELVRRGQSRRKNVKIARWTAVIAACVLFAVLIPLWYPLLTDVQQSGMAEDTTSAAEAAPGEDLQEAEAPPEAGQKPGGEQELIPLGFTLPENFTVEKAALDQGMSVYHLADTLQDPVVMQLEYAGEQGLRTQGLTEIEIAGRPVYGRSADAYHLLTFEAEGIVYTLTCAYDINTLVPLCETIL